MFFIVAQLQGSSVRPGGPWGQGVLRGLDGKRGEAVWQSQRSHRCFFFLQITSFQQSHQRPLHSLCARLLFSFSPADAERRRRQQAVHLQVLWLPQGRRGVGRPDPTRPDRTRPHWTGPDRTGLHTFCTYAIDSSGTRHWIIFVLYKTFPSALFNTVTVAFIHPHVFTLLSHCNDIDCVAVELEHYKLIFFQPKGLLCTDFLVIGRLFEMLWSDLLLIVCFSFILSRLDSFSNTLETNIRVYHVCLVVLLDRRVPLQHYLITPCFLLNMVEQDCLKILNCFYIDIHLFYFTYWAWI